MPPSYQRIERDLQALACDIGAAECHGMLCGMLSGPADFDYATWLRHVSGMEEIAAYTRGAPHASLSALVDDTADALADPNYSFALLLPDDDEPLAVRAGAFAGWCRGYLSGFGLAGIADISVLGEDAREFLADMQRFGTLAVEASGGEGDERALAELIEFTRIGVLYVRAEARSGAERSAGATDIH